MQFREKKLGVNQLHVGESLAARLFTNKDWFSTNNKWHSARKTSELNDKQGKLANKNQWSQLANKNHGRCLKTRICVHQLCDYVNINGYVSRNVGMALDLAVLKPHVLSRIQTFDLWIKDGFLEIVRLVDDIVPFECPFFVHGFPYRFPSRQLRRPIQDIQGKDKARQWCRRPAHPIGLTCWTWPLDAWMIIGRLMAACGN